MIELNITDTSLLGKYLKYEIYVWVDILWWQLGLLRVLSAQKGHLFISLIKFSFLYATDVQYTPLMVPVMLFD